MNSSQIIQFQITIIRLQCFLIIFSPECKFNMVTYFSTYLFYLDSRICIFLLSYFQKSLFDSEIQKIGSTHHFQLLGETGYWLIDVSGWLQFSCLVRSKWCFSTIWLWLANSNSKLMVIACQFKFQNLCVVDDNLWNFVRSHLFALIDSCCNFLPRHISIQRKMSIWTRTHATEAPIPYRPWNVHWYRYDILISLFVLSF